MIIQEQAEEPHSNGIKNTIVRWLGDYRRGADCRILQGNRHPKHSYRIISYCGNGPVGLFGVQKDSV